jgi:hypothetical protein
MLLLLLELLERFLRRPSNKPPANAGEIDMPCIPTNRSVVVKK